MKFIILAVLSYAVLLEAYPRVASQLIGNGVGSGFGGVVGFGTGVGAGLGMKGAEAVAVGTLSAAELGSSIFGGVGEGFATGLETGLDLVGIGEEAQGSGGYPNQQQQRQQRPKWQQQQQQQQQRRGNQGYNNRGQRQYAGPYSQNNSV